MNLLIPMAGEGARFKAEGYHLPKPCIPIDGIPMVIQATKSLPKAQKHLFICRDFHVHEGVTSTISAYYPQAEYIILDALTEGQAATCLKAQSQIDTDEPLMIGACDNAMIWDKEVFEALTQISDCVVWTFRNNASVLEHPQQYGWVKVKDDRVVETSIKKAISSSPKQDHAIVGAFWFKKGSEFVRASQDMIEANDRINGEFYVDKCIDYFLKEGKIVRVFEVAYYIGWGTPADLKTWEYWRSFFKGRVLE